MPSALTRLRDDLLEQALELDPIAGLPANIATEPVGDTRHKPAAFAANASLSMQPYTFANAALRNQWGCPLRLQAPLILPTTDFNRLCVLAPHPDDFDAIAVTLQTFHQAGWALSLLVLTPGVRGLPASFREGGAYTLAQQIHIREQEQQASIADFGLDATADGTTVQFLRLADNNEQQLSLEPENVLLLHHWLQRLRPDIVVMPHPHDSNQTHRRVTMLYHRCLTHNAALRANNPAGSDIEARRVGALNPLVLFNRDAKTRDMQDNFVTPFDQAAADAKARLLRLHKSQQQRNLEQRGIGFDERVLEMNRTLAERLDTGSLYAESFDLAVANLVPIHERRHER